MTIVDFYMSLAAIFLGLSFMLIGDVIIGAALISLAIGFSIARLY